MVLAIVCISFLICLLTGFPVAIAMGLGGVAGLIADGMSALVMGQKVFVATDSFALLAIPFFMLCGQLMEFTGVTDDLLKLSKALVGHLRGGLACTITVAGALMASITGSQNASAAAIGSLSVDAMRKDGYEDGFSVAVIAASGGLGPIIPPSIIMVIYCTTAGNVSVGQLFMAGVIPGILLAIGYCIIANIYARRHNMIRVPFVGVRNAVMAFVNAIPALLMPVIMIGGILSGIVTATESAVIASIYGLIYGLIRRKLNLTNLKQALVNSVINTCGPMGIIALCSLMGYMLIRQNLSTIMQNFMAPFASNPAVFMLILMIMLLIAGMFIDGTATLLILVPVLTPMVNAMGIDPLQFAIVFILALQTGGLTPPVGVLLFIVAGIGHVPLSKCVKPVIPFVLVMLIVVMLCIFFPGIGTWLPSVSVA